MRMYSAAGRSRWPWIIAGVIAVLAIAAGVTAFGLTRSNGAPGEPTAAPTSAPPSTSPTAEPGSGGDGDTGAAPTGCLGGNNRDVAMVLAAQKAAPHTMFGAVEAATAFTRWSLQYPYPSAADSNTVSNSVISPDAPASVKDIAGGYAKAEDITGGRVPVGTPYYLSTTNGLWLVSADSTSDRMTVSVNGSYVIDGALSPTKTAAIALVMVWQKDAWHVQSAEQPDVSKIAAGGTTYTGGC